MLNFCLKSDAEWIEFYRLKVDYYAFIERVGMILDDNVCNPNINQLEAARQQAAFELCGEKIHERKSE